MKLIRLIPIIFLLLATLVACRGQEEAATPPPPTAVTEQTAPDPTATLEPAATATLPMPPTVAPAPTITPTPEPEATAVPAGVLLIEPEDFGDDRNPFTGELVSDLDNLQRRPIAVKMSNAPPSFVRPQSGLNDADLVFEHITEGHITRLTLIFYGNTPPDVGPIRSGRLIDLELPAMYDAAFVFSGASTGVNQRLNRSDFAARILRGGLGYYRTGANKPYEHTLYGRLNLFWDQLEDLGLNSPPNFGSNMAFGSTPPANGAPANVIELDYRWEKVRWEYDEALDRYRRWAADQVVIDANSSEQVTAANVIVVYANHVEDGEICEEIRNDACLHLSLQIQVWGSGPATIFRDGQRYDVTWRRENRNDMLTFHDANGAPFPLQLGNSWFQMMPLGRESSVTVR
jgi:hypothetical protein